MDFFQNNRGSQNNLMVDSFILFALPVCIILWLPGVWFCFLGMVLLYAKHGGLARYCDCIKQYKGYFQYQAFVYSSYFILSLVSLFFLGSPLKSIDNSVIFLLWLLWLPILTSLFIDYRWFGYGCFIAVVAAFLLTIFQFHILKLARPYGTYGSSFRGDRKSVV